MGSVNYGSKNRHVYWIEQYFKNRYKDKPTNHSTECAFHLRMLSIKVTTSHLLLILIERAPKCLYWPQDIICGVSIYILTLYTFPILPTWTFHLNILTTVRSLDITPTSDIFSLCVAPAHWFRLIFDLNNSERSGPAWEAKCHPLSRLLPVREPESSPPSQQPARTLCSQPHKYRHAHALYFRTAFHHWLNQYFVKFQAFFDPCVQMLPFFTTIIALGVHKSRALSRPSD